MLLPGFTLAIAAKGLVPCRGDQLAVLAHPRAIQPPVDQPIDLIARLVGDPLLVHVVVDPRQDAQHFAAAAVEPDVRPAGVGHVDRERLLELPRPRLEGVRPRCQRADRAQVDDIGAHLVGGGFFEIGGDLHVLAAIERADFVDARHFLGEAHAAGAMDAAGHLRLDQRTHVFLGDGALVLVIAAGAPAIGHGLILQIALAALIADRAIERVVDQQEFHHALAGLADHFAVGADRLTLGGRQCAARLRLGRPRRDFDQAHAAIAGDGQPLVIAEARDFLAGEFAGLQDGGALRDFEFDAVDSEFRHISVLSSCRWNY